SPEIPETVFVVGRIGINGGQSRLVIIKGLLEVSLFTFIDGIVGKNENQLSVIPGFPGQIRSSSALTTGFFKPFLIRKASGHQQPRSQFTSLVSPVQVHIYAFDRVFRGTLKVR